MSERDELAQIIWDGAVDDRTRSGMNMKNVPVVRPKVEALADTVLAAGYRRPRTITTVEELDAAIYAAFEDAGHLIVADRHGRPWIIWGDEDGDEQVNSWPQEDDPERLTLADIALPATVLHEPDATL